MANMSVINNKCPCPSRALHGPSCPKFKGHGDGHMKPDFEGMRNLEMKSTVTVGTGPICPCVSQKLHGPACEFYFNAQNEYSAETNAVKQLSEELILEAKMKKEPSTSQFGVAEGCQGG